MKIWRNVLSIESAAVAGLVHAILLTIAIVLVQARPGLDASDVELVAFYADRSSRNGILVALNLAGLSAIAFLWFVAVIRRRIGSREDKLFATVFLGGGLTFIALTLVGVAVMAAPAVMMDTTGRTPEPDSIRLVGSAGRAILSILAPRFAAVFVLTTSTLGFRTGALRRWLTLVGQLVAVVMIINFTVTEPMPFFLPAWVALASVELLMSGRSSRPDEIAASDA